MELKGHFQGEVALQSAFKRLDADGNGKITAAELKSILGKNPQLRAKGEEYWEEMISEADQNGDGEVRK